MTQGGHASKYQNSHHAAGCAAVLALLLLPATLAPEFSPLRQASAQHVPVSPVAAAREAMQRKQWQKLPALAARAEAQGDPLAIYAQYWLVHAQLNTPDVAKSADAFLQRYAGAYLADRLRGDWILAAARSGDFATVRRLGTVRASNAQIDCARLNARHRHGPRVTAVEAQAIFEPGAACWALYSKLVADQVLGWAHLGPQLRDAIEIDQTAPARNLAAYLLTPKELTTYNAILRDPQAWLRQRSQSAPQNEVERELLLIALARAARKDRDAIDLALRKEYANQLAPADQRWLRSQLALLAALNLDARAHTWYREAGLDLRMSPYNHAWRVRSALRQPRIDWSWVQAAIARMPASQRTEPAWVYWEARALAAVGQSEAARSRYASLAKAHHFYGQLAAEELGQPISVPPAPDPVTEQELAAARAHPGLQRAIALFHAGWRQEAVPEWNFSLRGMNDRQLLAAAELARQENIYDRVVNTSERTTEVVDFSQRFIAPFEERIIAQAREIELDPAWVYGLIRQESRFIMNARSYVGASGLMQLMPATAKWTAQRIGMSDFKPSRINEFDVNTKLGAHYLNIVLQDLDGSQVLASAGYNAGPGRPKLWRSRLSHTVEGAIFAETIPFSETRDYVKKVMSNATYYAAVFSGEPQSLKARLGQVAPQPARASQVP